MPVCKEELSRGNIVRVERGCSRLFIAGRTIPSRLSRPGRGETGRTTAQTSMPPSNNARRGGHEKLAGMPRKSTRGGRSIKKIGRGDPPAFTWREETPAPFPGGNYIH